MNWKWRHGYLHLKLCILMFALVYWHHQLPVYQDKHKTLASTARLVVLTVQTKMSRSAERKLKGSSASGSYQVSEMFGNLALSRALFQHCATKQRLWVEGNRVWGTDEGTINMGLHPNQIRPVYRDSEHSSVVCSEYKELFSTKIRHSPLLLHSWCYSKWLFFQRHISNKLKCLFCFQINQKYHFQLKWPARGIQWHLVA